MCGIVGVVDDHTAHLATIVRAMAACLEHRGPDDSGVEYWADDGVAMGHRRLSIIDLSPAGHQPMAGANSRVWISYNGEVYNFRELRRELVAQGEFFRSQTDTEVVLRAYERWGPAFVARLRGMFALAIWDSSRRTLLLARDRLGIKPLYYARIGSGLAFASEPKALLAHPAIGARLDPAALADYFTYGYVPYDRSIFSGVQKVPAATVMTHESGRSRLVDYWGFAPDGDSRTTTSLDELRATLAEAVRLESLADVPVGAFLSGGLDSSVVTALMAQSSTTPVKTLTVGFDGGPSELPYAQLVAERYHTDHRVERIGLDDAGSLLRTLVRVYDEPLADISTIPTYLLCKASRDHVKVAVSGDGGDELFAGYSRYGRMARANPSRLGAALVGRVRRVPRMWRAQTALRRLEPDVLRRYHLYAGLFDEWELGRLAGPSISPALAGHDALWLYKKFFRTDLPLVTALQWLDLKTYLVDDILVKVDRASMAHSLEVRPPMLDHEVVELAFRITATAQRDSTGGKSFFKAAFLEYLPPQVAQRSKQGFSPPTTEWFKSSLWRVARERIVNGSAVRDGWIDRTFVDQLVRNYTERRWLKVWALWFFEEWYRTWIDGSSC